MKLLLVFNPIARHGRAHRLLADIQEAFAERAIVTDSLITNRRGHATEHVAGAALEQYDGVVAAGGDGTVFEVLNGLYRRVAEQRIPLGVIPIGTGNAFARDLGMLPGDWRRGVAIIAAGHLRKVDVAQVTTAAERFHFLNVMGLGFAVAAGLTAFRLKRLGEIAYTLGTLWQTLRLKSHALHIEIDGQAIEQENIFVEISNTRYTGTNFLIAPGAELDDGLLDVTILRKLPRLRLLRLFPTVFSGRHVQYPEVSVLRGKSIRIGKPEGYLLAPDGEFMGATPAEINCLHRDLTIFGP